MHVPAQAAPEFVTQIRSKGLAPVRPTTTFERIHAVIRRIPRGRVATYGDIASLAGRSIAFNAKSRRLMAVATVTLLERDLRLALPFLLSE